MLLGSGLVARYPLRRPRLGGTLLLCVPVVDLVLLGATIGHLHEGATADFTHGLAAAYLGFTVAFGHAVTRRADAHFAHRFAGDPSPRDSRARAPHGCAMMWQTWLRTLGAWLVACAVLLGGIVLVDDATRTQELADWVVRLTALLLPALAWAMAYTMHEAWAGRAARRRGVATRDTSAGRARKAAGRPGRQ